MTETSDSPARIDLMNLSGYIVLAALTMTGLWVFIAGEHPYRGVAALILALFAVLSLLPDAWLGGFKVTYPNLYIGLMSGLVVALTLLPPATPWFVVMFFLLSPEVMLRFSRQVGYAWVGAFCALTIVIFFLSGDGALGMVLQALIYIAGYFFFAAFATQTAFANEARVESQRLLAELQAAHARLQAYAAQAEELAAAEERNRLAREMHDTLGHALTMSVVQLEGAQRLVESDPSRAAKIIGTVREELRGELAELRRTLTALRAPLEVELPLSQAFTRLSGRFEEVTRLPVRLSLPAVIPDLSAEYRQVFYRAAQEGLTNVQRHAQAHQVDLVLTLTDDWLTLAVCDDGIGMQADAAQVGFGLRGLQERAAQLGGTFTVDARPGGGTQLQFALPLSAGGLAHG